MSGIEPDIYDRPQLEGESTKIEICHFCHKNPINPLISTSFCEKCCEEFQQVGKDTIEWVRLLRGVQ